MGISRSDQNLNQGIFVDKCTERTEIEQSVAIDVTVPLEQVATSVARLEDVTSPQKTKNGSLNGKKKN